jgi:cytochrome c oxidase cbb3-type subunit I
MLTSILFIAVVGLLSVVLWTVLQVRLLFTNDPKPAKPSETQVKMLLENLDGNEIAMLLQARKKMVKAGSMPPLLNAPLIICLIFLVNPAFAQNNSSSTTSDLLSEPGIIITIVLLLVPLTVAVVFLMVRVNRLVRQYQMNRRKSQATQLADYLLYMDAGEIERSLVKRTSRDYQLNNCELSGIAAPADPKGLITGSTNKTGMNFVATKKKALKRPSIDPQFSKLILWYLGTAIFWLVFGTTVGEYLGLKFVAPDMDQTSWLSFGRLRPVHTNAVFWGWSSLAMLGLGYYVVSVVSNASIGSFRKGWISLYLINASVLLGTVSLMAGINNGGGEYREYTWPVMALFGAGLVITLLNFFQTISRRTTNEIYISNWYIVSAIMFTLVIAFIAYWPSWQNGLGETIVQGYYMHQGVGMWFMLFTLGIIYYFLPQQLNKPIYSYSLGILAFWTQILFYTVIGTHHFVFSSIPWWLQTVAIVGSMGMLIPVVAGTTNFLMTFKGDWHKITHSYTLPFFIVGIVFYFTGSSQGTAEAFRYTNLVWHFTDFTVAHSHITMYGIIAFILWAGIYALVPRLTGKEPPQLMVGAHFWLAFIGLLFYSIPLMIGGTLKGMLWMDGKPFMEGVTLMAPYWLWRAIGGSMMWVSHLVFAYNFYKMVGSAQREDVNAIALKKIKEVAAAKSETM